MKDAFGVDNSTISKIAVGRTMRWAKVINRDTPADELLPTNPPGIGFNFGPGLERIKHKSDMDKGLLRRQQAKRNATVRITKPKELERQAKKKAL